LNAHRWKSRVATSRARDRIAWYQTRAWDQSGGGRVTSSRSIGKTTFTWYLRTMLRAMPSDLANKVFIVTGANTGIGKVTATELARAGAHVILACRSQDKTAAVIAEITRETGNTSVEYFHLDLGDLS